ncbi:HesB/IscA family protein [Stella sp.]|uniref:HesB/IscA family protein n=1 Tax=Stella sp. TaxID=2912054 RepID=UPI0035B1C02C
MARPQAMQITDAAAERVKALLAKRGKPSAGIRIGVRTKGCSGLSYTLEYADEANKFDEVVEDKGVRILIDPKASMFIIGTEMDFVDGKLESGFVFKNPNEKGRCGCGESFHV